MTIYRLIFIVLASTLVGCSSARHTKSEHAQAYAQFRSTQKTFQSTDGNIRYLDQGQGEVILLLHGVPSSSWLYRKMVPELVEAGYRVIVPDMLGFGNSDNPKDINLYTPAHHSKRIVELMDHLKVPSWNHVMHDAGGLWTWELLKNYPGRVKKLVVLNTILFAEGFHPPIRMKEGGFARFSMWLYKNGFTTNMLLKQLFKEGVKKENALTESEVEGYKRPLLEGKTNAMYYFFTRTCNNMPNYDDVIENVSIPVRVIWGKEDEMLQLEPQLERVKKSLKIAGNQVYWLDAKHFIQEEEPALINSLIVEFIK